uniref:Uncharacterized protein n=1 Tax=Anguilla anguilla TaxID=7936 RepID=A0A0E9UFF0_ANGAN
MPLSYPPSVPSVLSLHWRI